MNTTRTTAATLASIALLLPLAACGGGQSVSEACDIAQTEVRDATGDLSSIDPTNTAAATKTLSTMSDTLDKLEDKLTNAEVKKAVGDLAEDFDQLEDAFEDLQEAGTDTTKLQAVSTQLTDLSSSIQKKGAKLDELCS